MNKIFTLLLVLISGLAYSQDFNQNLATAKTSYSSGDLEEARFAMQQMINDLDIAIGKEILKLLPETMNAAASNAASDNVTGNTGIAGVLIHRDYGSAEKLTSIDIMDNSPLVASLNAILALPFLASSGDGTQKVIRIDGYKAILQKNVDAETNKADFTVQVPINATLLTLTVADGTEADVIKMANTIPVREIANMVQ